MRIMLLTAIALSTAGGPLPAVTSSPAQLAFSEVIGALLQGDGPRALRILRDVPDAELGNEDRAERQCVTDRLRGARPLAGPGGLSPDTAQILAAYQTYWVRAVSDPAAQEIAEKELLDALNGFLGLDFPTLDGTEKTLEERLRSEGVTSMEGRTGLLHDFYAWRSQTRHEYNVALPEGHERVTVFFLRNFISRGWEYYITCDRTGAAGWTKPEGLYIQVASYKNFTDENFRISYLAHEGQHFADNRNYPGLPSWRLEYRAKLVELAEAITTRDTILMRFASNQGDDENSPHSYANRRVLTRLRSRLGISLKTNLADVSVARLKKAALRELHTDSAQLRDSFQRPKSPAERQRAPGI